MVDVKDLQKALANRPIRCPPEKTQEEYIEEWEEWFEDFEGLFSAFPKKFCKRICPLHSHIEYMDDNCRATHCEGECHPNYGKGSRVEEK